MRTLYSVRLEGLAANPAAPADLLLLILERAEPRMRNALLRREGVPDAVYEAAARHPDPRTRRLVAAAGHAPVAIRAGLAADPDPAVRRAVASAPEYRGAAEPLPRDVLARLAADPDAQVRDALCGNAALPGAVRAALAADPDAKVRMRALLGWPEPPDEVVDAALEDPDPAVRRLAMRLACHRRPEFAAPLLATGQASAVSTVPLDGDQARELCRDPSPATRAAAAANPHLPADLVEVLAADPAHEVRLAVSLRPELTEDRRAAIDYHVGPHDRLHPPEWLWARLDDLGLMRRCAASAHVGLRRFAAYSPHLPADVVARLAADDDFVVRLLLSEHHPDPPGDLLLAVALESPFITRLDRVGHPSFPSAGLARLAGSADPVARVLALRDPALGPGAVERLSRDPDPAVRAAAARDGRLPAARLLELLDDPDAAAGAARNPHLPESAMKRILYDVAII
ncbi:LRV domain-containing protein [Actinomadura sp. 6K520]|uniref:LRV domain-containing protein n=1 Tax=Actinomadura sp. 6K520 TaxID=2530364 RepID=UPI001047B14F|nr:LRV domain-containing protein [Actinomadura sp. 6K520]TDE32867.1 LRV domain-containing protein [Actinomadura sp. 6K520]